jgi:prepilin-type N-terminal cleavage/methylation domain-containing protein
MKKQGFTLIELLIVIAIIGILISIVAPVIRRAKEEREKKAASSLTPEIYNTGAVVTNQ